MVGTPDILAGRSVAFGLVSLGTAAARPNFELRFSVLQNTIIDRLNKEIEAVNESSRESVDAFLLSSQKKLEAFQAKLGAFTFANTRNAWNLSDLAGKVDDLQTALNAADTATFNSVLHAINENVGRLSVPNGAAVGILLDDGITAIRRNGLINVTRDGAKERVTSFAQFTDNAEAQSAINAAKSTITRSLNAVLARAEAAAKLNQVTDKNLVATKFQIEATKAAQDVELAAEVAKLRQKYAIFLNDLSLAFESNQALAEQLGKGLFDPNKVDPGSVLNIFT
ncbi:MAG: hypothetical protein FJ311_03945 [Rhodospirillales bacterium]|nr:hypothetical protein [Rhodospirillales bacterium]